MVSTLPAASTRTKSSRKSRRRVCAAAAARAFRRGESGAPSAPTDRRHSAQHRGRQRRRGRTRHLQRPHHPAQQPLPSARRRSHRSPRRRRRSDHRRNQTDLHDRDRARCASRSTSFAGRVGPGVRLDVFEGPERVPLRRRNRAARNPRRPLPVPPHRTAVPTRGTRGRHHRCRPPTPPADSPHPSQLAGPHDHLIAPPTLVDNVETLANIPRILARGARLVPHRSEPTNHPERLYAPSPARPDTPVSARSSWERRYAMSSTRSAAGARPGHEITAVLPGVSNALIPASTPRHARQLRSARRHRQRPRFRRAFIVFDDGDDLVAVAAGVSRFLAVESCGQCTPCKLGGKRIAALLELLARVACHRSMTSTPCATTSRASPTAPAARSPRNTRPSSPACSTSIPTPSRAHLTKRRAATAPALIAELVDLHDGIAEIDEHHRDKQPDWTYNPVPSGKTPAARLGDHRKLQSLDH